MPAELLESHPDVGLDVLDQMPEMDMPVGIRQCGGNEDAAVGHGAIVREVVGGRKSEARRSEHASETVRSPTSGFRPPVKKLVLHLSLGYAKMPPS
jgi:hypothetical protein